MPECHATTQEEHLFSLLIRFRSSCSFRVISFVSGLLQSCLDFRSYRILPDTPIQAEAYTCVPLEIMCVCVHKTNKLDDCHKLHFDFPQKYGPPLIQ